MRAIFSNTRSPAGERPEQPMTLMVIPFSAASDATFRQSFPSRYCCGPASPMRRIYSWLMRCSVDCGRGQVRLTVEA